MKTETKESNHALDQARAQLESIRNMIKQLKEAQASGDEAIIDTATTEIDESPLSVEVRSGWYTPGAEKIEPGEFSILLCTGGPAVRIIGDLDQYKQPESARLQYQDWFTPWTNYKLTGEDEEVLLSYAGQFYYGE